MDGRNTMMASSADDIEKLTQRLKAQGDISLEEADWIYSFCLDKIRSPIFEPRTDYTDHKLIMVLQDWYRAVTAKIERGERGNFIFTISLAKYFEFMGAARYAIKQHGSFEDLCNVIIFDERLYSKLPYKNLFEKIYSSGTSGKDYHILKTFRAGAYYYPVKTESGFYTISQFMKKLSPTIRDEHYLLDILFETAAGIFVLQKNPLPFPMNSGWVKSKEIKALTLGSFLKYNDISCVIASDTYQGRSIVFVEQERAPLVKEALTVSFEELVNNALYKNIINTEEARKLLNENYIPFPGVKFIKESVQYINDIVQTKIQWKTVREEVEEENAWLEEIR